MIVLDTHIWVWWVHANEQLTASQAESIQANERDVIGVSVISVWEVAKLVQYARLELPCPLHEWFGYMVVLSSPLTAGYRSIPMSRPWHRREVAEQR